MCGCSNHVDISGLYINDIDREKGYRIEHCSEGYKVTIVSYRNGDIIKESLNQYLDESPNNRYKIYIDTSKKDFFEVKADFTGLKGSYRKVDKQAIGMVFLRKVNE